MRAALATEIDRLLVESEAAAARLARLGVRAEALAREDLEAATALRRHLLAAAGLAAAAAAILAEAAARPTRPRSSTAAHE